MNASVEFLVRAFFLGAGATLVLDLWTLTLNRLGVKSTDWSMVGRWIGNMPRGRFVHDNIAKADAVAGERLLGWSAHYATGVVYAALFLVIAGLEWARQPTLAPALIFGVATVAAPFLIMQPAMGAGLAASRTPKPWAARLKSLLSHTVFGLGLFAAAALAALILRS